jgi:hypothetical protein
VVYVGLIDDNGVQCGDERIEPLVFYDCDVTWPRSSSVRSAG